MNTTNEAPVSGYNKTTSSDIRLTSKIPWSRPYVSRRKFTSKGVEAVILEMKHRLVDKDVATLFENCFTDTLDNAIAWTDSSKVYPRTYVVAGKLGIMFMRDSTQQILPYVPYAPQDPLLQDMILGVIMMQAEFLAENPYGDSFYPPPESGLPRPKNPWDGTDFTKPVASPSTWQSKWSADSLASFFKLSYQYWHHTNDDYILWSPEWLHAVKVAMRTLVDQQEGSMQELGYESYLFTRQTRRASETLVLDGRGSPVQRTGLVKSQFRPSDDAAAFPFGIATNAMLAVELEHIHEMLKTREPDISESALRLSGEIRAAVLDNGVAHHTVFGSMFAYEVDGYGSMNLMDDSAIPSLISLPYIGFLDRDDAVYQATRRFALSRWNKYWFTGNVGQGIGSLHSGLGYIWPASVTMEILTSSSDEETMTNIELLKTLAAVNGLLPQAVWRHDEQNQTLAWLPAANSLFATAVLHLANEKPHLLFDVPPPKTSSSHLGFLWFIPAFLIILSCIKAAHQKERTLYTNLS